MKNLSKLSTWLVNNLDTPIKIYDISTMKQRYPHLNGIEFPCKKDLDVTILIGTDHTDLSSQGEFHAGRGREPMAVTTKLDWVLKGVNKCNKKAGLCKFLCDNYTSTIAQIVTTSGG